MAKPKLTSSRFAFDNGAVVLFDRRSNVCVVTVPPGKRGSDIFTIDNHDRHIKPRETDCLKIVELIETYAHAWSKSPPSLQSRLLDRVSCTG